MFIEYVVFFALLASGIVFYILHEIRMKKLGLVKEDTVRKSVHTRNPESPNCLRNGKTAKQHTASEML